MEQITPQNCPWPNLLCIECNEVNCWPEAVSQSGQKKLVSASKIFQRKIDKIKSDKSMTPSVRRSLLVELGVV